MHYSDAIKAWRKHRGWSQETLGEKLGYKHPQSRIGNYERGPGAKHGREPSLDDLTQIAEAFGCENVSLFLDGPDSTTDSGAASSRSRVSVSRLVGVHLSAGSGEIIWEHEEIENSHVFQVDWMRENGLVAAKCKIVKVRGDSMWPTIPDGSTCLVNTADRDPRHNKIFAIIDEDGLRLKRLLRRADGSWEIHSDNPAKTHYPTESYVPGKVALWGRVPWWAVTD